MVVHPFEVDVGPFILDSNRFKSQIIHMIQAINNFDKVFNQETEFGEMLAKQISNPRTILSIYHHNAIKSSEKISHDINFVKYCIFVAIIVFSILKFLLNIPGDIKIENQKRKFFNIQKRNDCYLEYIENQCNSTTSPELLKHCQKLYSCYKSIDQNSKKKISFISFEWDLVNNFFFFLSKKSAAFLGFSFGCFLYYNFTH